MKQHESYMNTVAQISKSKSEFIVAGLSAKLPMDELSSQANNLFHQPPPPPAFSIPPPPLPFPSKVSINLHHK